MRKALLLLGLAILCALPAQAQEKEKAKDNNEVAISISFPYEMVYEDMTYESEIWDLYSGYEPGFRNTRYTALFGVEYHRFITKRIKLGGILSYYGAIEDAVQPVSDIELGKHYRNNVALMAQARYCYLHTDKWQLYSGVGLGGSMLMGTMKGTKPTFKPALAAEAIIFGAEFGPKVPFYWEMVAGNRAVLFRFGLAYKF